MTDALLSLARAEIVAMRAYRSARSEQVNGTIWLDANENPWDNTLYNRYPEPQPSTLMTNLATLYAVAAEQLLITRGSDEGIDLLVRLFCRAGKDKIMICPPTYGMYKIAATIQDAVVVEVPLNKTNHFSLDVSTILAKWQPTIKLIFLCSPNNPTGNVLATKDILALSKQLANKAIVVVDEAYLEFSNNESMTNYVDDYPNLVILRTLSKAYGLAGIRCGVTIANNAIILLLKKIIAPYPIPAPIGHLAVEQLQLNNLKTHIDIIIQERDKLFNFLSRLPYVKNVWKSEANFILFEVQDANKIMNACLDQGVVLRDRSREFGLANCIRLTVGTPDENTFVREVLNGL